ncbi:hypothetical protein GALLN_00577 [Gallionellaceae bacterium]|nr:hypothetical protein GALLN_00577 [Gallionellaceae bacterium]
MAKKISAGAAPAGRSNIVARRDISPEQHENMVREAAYFRYMSNPVPGHELDDWLAAEAELFWGKAERRQRPEPAETAEFGMQEGGAHGFWVDDALKRITKQHPRTGIPKVESVEPPQAPRKE